jgi:hypothetical protein
MPDSCESYDNRAAVDECDIDVSSKQHCREDEE